MSTDPALMNEEPLAAPQRSFLGNVNIVMITYALDGALALATGALIARALGPDGRGAFSLFVVSAAFGQLLLGLGAGNAAIYYLNKRELALRDIVSAMHVIVIAAAALTAGVVAVIAPFAADDAFGDGVAPWLLIAAVPLMLHMNLMRLTLQALSRFVDLGIATVGQQAIMLALVGALFASDEATSQRVVLSLIAASACVSAYGLLRVGVRNIDPAQIARPRLPVLRTLARFGVQGEAGNVLQLLNYRLDQYILRAFTGLSAVGIYAVSASMTEGIFILANAVALVLMPRLTSGSDEDVAWMTPVATRNTVMMAAAGAVVLALAAPLLLPAIFGDRFEDSVRPLWWLLPGTVALTGSKVLTSYIFSQGRPLVNTGITCVSLVVTLVADFALIPAFGVEGAAAASSLAYTAHLGAALFAYHRISGRSPLDALVPRPADAHLYRDALRSITSKLGRRTQLEPRG